MCRDCYIPYENWWFNWLVTSKMTSLFAHGVEASINLGIKNQKPQYECENVSSIIEDHHY